MNALILLLALLIVFFKLFYADKNSNRAGNVILQENKNLLSNQSSQVFYLKDTVAGKQLALTAVISASAREDRISVYSRSPYFFKQIIQDQNDVAA